MSSKKFLEKYGPWAVVAGASKGLGEAFARNLAGKGLNLVLIARSEDVLTQLGKSIAQEYGVQVKTVTLDLSEPDVVEKLKKTTDSLEIGLMVYNACYSHVGAFFKTDLKSKLKTLEVNCRGPLLFVSEFGQKMLDRGKGGILLMSSMHGFQGGALWATYAASKAFNTVLAEGLWDELRKEGVDVTTVATGAIRTPNFEAQTPDAKQKMAMPMEPEDVAKEALNNLGKKSTHIAGAMNRATYRLLSMMPRQAATAFIGITTRQVYPD